METFKEQNAQINKMASREEEKSQKCLDAYEAVQSCLQYCLTRNDWSKQLAHITLLKECSQITQLTSSFLQESSYFKNQMCNLCAQICTECAKSCASLDPHDLEMNSCAHICRECGESCLSLVH